MSAKRKRRRARLRVAKGAKRSERERRATPLSGRRWNSLKAHERNMLLKLALQRLGVLDENGVVR